ncbi:MAG: hypothetical protein JOY62_06075 [Acidobacteriaceae bacterium]|nr:hypothetical protein [Acidobacteriaceae bacterium]MBV9779525.1 hypothetical protein [Acidobacteriaceae bacterium]
MRVLIRRDLLKYIAFAMADHKLRWSAPPQDSLGRPMPPEMQGKSWEPGLSSVSAIYDL